MHYRTPKVLKNIRFEHILFQNRIVIATLLVLLTLSGLLGRMIYLQIFQYDHFSTLSDSNRVHIQPVAPPRGNIYDRNGILLATNQTTFSLEITPEQVSDLEQTLETLKTLIPYDEEDLERFYKEKKRSRYFDPVPLRFRLSEEEVAHFEARRHQFPGVEVHARLTRHYPLHPLTAHLVGYVGRINEQELKQINPMQYRGIRHIGKTGVEQFYEDQLRGTPGVRQVETNVIGRVLRVLEEDKPTSGEDLFLTLDSNLQTVANEAMRDRRGAVVAIQPKTGEVLAMLSTPAFNTNLFVNGINRKDYRALQDSKSRPLFNRFLRGQYPPGSTVKPFVALAGLEMGEIHASQEIFCPGYYQIHDYEHKYHDWKRTGHGRTNLNKAMAESCDVYFYDLAFHLGINNIHKYLANFGFGEPTGIDLSGEKKGILPSREWKQITKELPWYPGETLNVGIGQGFFTATPIQLATAVAALANGGNRIRPHLLYAARQNAAESPKQQPTFPTQPIPIKNFTHWEQVYESMRRVAHSRRGTARKIGQKAKYTIAGKTGTAQVYTIKQGEEYDEKKIPEYLWDHALFVAFAPLENPQIAVAVIVENGGHGGAVAAPIARKVMDYYLLNRPEAS